MRKRYKYFVVNDFMQDEEIDKKTFIYYVKEFARYTFNEKGEKTYKTNYSDIWHAYNPQGILIAWKEAAV